MAEHGFYSPGVGYWQTNADPSEETISSYPEGTVEVPLRPEGSWEWDGSKWGAAVPLPVKYRISKSAPWARMTRDEAEAMDAVLRQSPARTQQMYAASQYLFSDDEVFTEFFGMLKTVFSVVRAEELIAPENN